MGAVYSDLPEEERQVIQIKIGNGNSIRVIGVMLSGSVSTISREIKRNTCCPSNESELYRRTGPKYLKTGSCAVRPCVAADPAMQGRTAHSEGMKKPYHLLYGHLWAQVPVWLGRIYSPLPVRGRLRVLWPDDRFMPMRRETIYQ